MRHPRKPPARPRGRRGALRGPGRGWCAVISALPCDRRRLAGYLPGQERGATGAPFLRRDRGLRHGARRVHVRPAGPGSAGRRGPPGHRRAPGLADGVRRTRLRVHVPFREPWVSRICSTRSSPGSRPHGTCSATLDPEPLDGDVEVPSFSRSSSPTGLQVLNMQFALLAVAGAVAEAPDSDDPSFPLAGHRSRR